MKIYSMTMCPFCGKVYDESEYTHCPKCGEGKILKAKRFRKKSRTNKK